MGQRAVTLRLNKMFSDGFFDVCVIRDCASVLRIDAPSEDMDIFRVLHCVEWGDMGSEMKLEVAHRVAQIFGYKPTETAATENPSTEHLWSGDIERRGILHRLLGRGSEP